MVSMFPVARTAIQQTEAEAPIVWFQRDTPLLTGQIDAMRMEISDRIVLAMLALGIASLLELDQHTLKTRVLEYLYHSLNEFGKLPCVVRPFPVVRSFATVRQFAHFLCLSCQWSSICLNGPQ
jgi:hypothetical protein